MIYDDMIIYYIYTIKKKFAKSDFCQINSVFTSQWAFYFFLLDVMNFCMELSKTEVTARVSFT